MTEKILRGVLIYIAIKFLSRNVFLATLYIFLRIRNNIQHVTYRIIHISDLQKKSVIFIHIVQKNIYI